MSEDSALAAKVLMIANSALFNFPSKIDTISKAITIIGHKQLSEIILSCSIVSLFKDIPQNIIDMEQFWRHSIAVATTARILASSRREQNIEKFFTAGLLHDIGKLILFVEAPKYVKEIIDKSAESNNLMHKVELEVLGFDHAKLGAMLLKKWKLPEEIVTSVYYHHMPSISSGDIINPGVIHIAGYYKVGMDDYLSKPFSQEDIQKKLQKWVRTEEAEKSVKKDGLSESVRMEHFDVVALNTLKSVMGDEFSDLVTIYIQNSSGLCESAMSNIDNFEKLIQYIHGLKGSSGNMGAMKLFSMCQDFELQFHQDKDVNCENINKIMDELKFVHEYLKN